MKYLIYIILSLAGFVLKAINSRDIFDIITCVFIGGMAAVIGYGALTGQIKPTKP